MLRLTKNKLRELDLALTLDDVLYEKFRRLNEELSKREARFARRRSNFHVLLQESGKVYRALQVLEIHCAPDGTELVVR